MAAASSGLAIYSPHDVAATVSGSTVGAVHFDGGINGRRGGWGDLLGWAWDGSLGPGAGPGSGGGGDAGNADLARHCGRGGGGGGDGFDSRADPEPAMDQTHARAGGGGGANGGGPVGRTRAAARRG